jgi:TolB protein
MNIFFINPDGTGKVQMTGGHDNGLPSWSPTGAKLVYVCRNPQTKVPNICMMNSDGSNPHPVLYNANTPMWSPDGTLIAYTSNKTGTAEIWTMRTDGTSQKQLTNSKGFQKVHPTWSANGKSIAYARVDATGLHDSIWTMTASGGNQRQLTTGTWNNLDANGNIINTANDANSPDWSPVTNTIVFWSGIENQNGQIWSINSDGTGRVQLTNDASSNNDDPEWSADGAKILFSTNRTVGTTQEMWVMNADGSSQQAITANTADPLPGDAAWQPVP